MPLSLLYLTEIDVMQCRDIFFLVNLFTTLTTIAILNITATLHQIGKVGVIAAGVLKGFVMEGCEFS